MQCLTTNPESSADSLAFLKKYNLLDAIYNCSNAWNDVTQQTLQNCWNKLIERPEVPEIDENSNEEEREEELFFSEQLNLSRDDVNDWLYNDGAIDTATEEDIIEGIFNEIEEDEEVSLNDINDNEVSGVKLSDAIDAIDLNFKLMSLEKHSDLYEEFFTVFDRYRKILVQKHSMIKKHQSKVTDFFQVSISYLFFILTESYDNKFFTDQRAN